MAKNKSYDEDFKKMIVELYESHTTTAANIVLQNKNIVQTLDKIVL